MAKWLKSPQTLLFEIRGHVAYITLNQPEKRNALSNAAKARLDLARHLNESRRKPANGKILEFKIRGNDPFLRQS